MNPSSNNLSFDNTEVAFATKNNHQLRRSYWLFKLMHNNALVNIGIGLTRTALKLNLPIRSLVKATIYPQFCGGETLEESLSDVEGLAKYNVFSVLDYGVEAESTESSEEETADMLMKIMDFAGTHPDVPIISCKLTGLIKFEILEKLHIGTALTEEEQQEYERFYSRVNKICAKGAEKGVALFIDAEETWIQNPIDAIVHDMMEKYNKEKVMVWNTFQMYKKEALNDIKKFHEQAKGKYFYGAKLVRGAYMEKERERAEKMGYPSPIHDSKEGTDADFDKGLTYCVNNIDTMATCAATHNEASSHHLVNLINEKGLPKDHPRIFFCQLYGMSDHITFNLAKNGYRVGKYVPFGPVKDVIPYLMRRAQENTSVGGQMGRELMLINKEMKRRKM